ncbi:MAG: TonB-dependent receptor [Candidatus Marinimicrobia bacterium]|nr:TonB-dependent receptor [Candidatus Neomarinimicrobiota bacterium]
MKKILVATFCFLLFSVVIIIAGTTGKISGRVVDATTGEPLVGVNVVIEGTTMGAATDIDGYFVILNIPPGLYDITASMIGYATYTIRSARVEIDLTTTLDFRMKQEVLKGEVVEVIAQRKVIKKDIAASQRSITSKEIESLPISSVTEAIGMQAGVTSGLSIRGSGSDEVIFMVDGIILRDERTNQPMTSLPLSAVQEISVQSGGFTAEYHNVRSGVVNVVAKEGNPKYYSGTFSMRYSPPAPKHFGISPFDNNSFWLRPYLDPEVCWTGTDNGAWDIYTQRQYPSFEGGWNAVSQSTLQDDDPSNDLSPAGAKKLYEWEHRKKGYIHSPDRNIDFGFGGPVPLISSSLGNLRFYLSYRSIQNMYLVHLNTDGVYDQSTMLKLTSDITPSMKLSLLGIYGELQATTNSRTGGTSYMDNVWDIADAVDRSGHTITWRIYTNDYWCPTSRYYNTISAKLTNMLGSGTFYEMQVKRIGKIYRTSHGAIRDTSRVNEIFQGYFVDEAPFGFWEEPTWGIDGMGMGGAISTSRDYSEFTTWTARFDFTSQVNYRNQVKTGLEFVYDSFDMDFGMVMKFLPEGNTWSKFTRKPYRGTAYLQDKIEYEGFIGTIGIIAEYIDPNGNWYDTDFYSREFFSTQFSSDDEDIFKSKKAKPKLSFSPRIGISHPITVNSKMYFNYGHYRQMPTSERLYRIQRAPNNQLAYLGDPTLPLAKTITYELGYDHSLFDTYLLHLSAYYKDKSNQENWTTYISVDGKVNYDQLTANHYEDTRGFEIDISKIYGRWVTGGVNLEYRVGTSGYFGVGTYYENPSDQREYLRLNPYQSKPIPRPRVKSNIDFHTPLDFGPKLWDQKPLGGWNFNFIVRWTSGGWFTWNPDRIPGITYNVQWRDYHNVDLKVSKVFSFGKARVKFFVDVSNLLNHKDFSGVCFYDSHDYDYYMYSLHFPEETAEKLGKSGSPYPNIPGDDRPGDYRKSGVEYQPIEWTPNIEDITSPLSGVIYYDTVTEKYMEYFNSEWVQVSSKRMDKILDTKAYIDMPNQSYYTFLTPRDIFFGITVSFDLR